MSTWPSPRVDRLGTPKTPAIRFTRAMTFVASWFTHLVRPTSLLASLNGSDRISPAIGGFYVRASGGSVTLPAAGYDYNSDWTPLLAGLSPARMTTSFAAPTPSSQWTFTTYSLPVPGARTRVAACTHALSPIRDTLFEGFRVMLAEERALTSGALSKMARSAIRLMCAINFRHQPGNTWTGNVQQREPTNGH